MIDWLTRWASGLRFPTLLAVIGSLSTGFFMLAAKYLRQDLARRTSRSTAPAQLCRCAP